MRVLVIIPTTDRPAQVLRLAPLKNAPRSVMRTQDDYRPLPVSAAYQNFTEPGGLLDVAFGLDAAAFDLRLSTRIDTGRSWELPVALAHWLQAHGHHSGNETPELVVWSTGALDLDMTVIEHDYHLATKLSGSLDLLNAMAAEGSRVVVLLPDAAQPPIDLPAGVVARQVNSFAEAIEYLRSLMEIGIDGPPASASRARGRFSRAGLGTLGSVGVGVGVVVLATLTFLEPQAWRGGAVVSVSEDGMTPAEVEETDAALEKRYEGAAPTENGSEAETVTAPETQAAVLPTLILLRPDEGASCIDLHFGGADPVRERHAAETEGFEEASLEGVCAMGLQLPEQATGELTVQLPEALLAHVTRSDQLAEFRLVPGEERLFRLTADLPDGLELRWRVTDTTGGTREFRHSLTAQR